MIRRFLSQPTMKFFRQANTDHPTPRALHQGKASDSRSKDQANDQSGNGSKRDGHGDFTEGHELDRKWKVAKQMVGRRLSQEEAKRLLAKLD